LFGLHIETGNTCDTKTNIHAISTQHIPKKWEEMARRQQAVAGEN
jgi:hypothetical protein